MAPSDAELAIRARRAYELGRLQAKLPQALFAVPPAAVALPVCDRAGLTLPLAVLLAAALVLAHWRGEAAARGASVGLLGGALGFATPVLASLFGQCMASSLMVLLICGGGGVLSGGVLAITALRQDRQRALFLIAGGLVAGLTGALGCVVGGLGGLVGLSVGVCLGMAPAVLARSGS